MPTRLRVGTSGTMPATAEDVGGTGAAAMVLTRVAQPGLPDDIAWRTIAQTYAANWAVTDWYLDGTVGNDANNGTTAATPLRTGEELARRLGPYAIWRQSVTVHVLTNGMTDALVLRGMLAIAGTHLDVAGTTTLLFNAGALTLYQGVDHAVPRATQISCANVPDWTPYQWSRLRVTSGASTGACSWVAAPNPAGAGLNVARVSRFCIINPAATANMQNTANPAPPDTIIIESLPLIPAITLLVDGPIDNTVGPNYGKRQWSITDVNCPTLAVASSGFAAYGRTIVFGCQLSQCAYSPVGNQSAVSTVQSACFYDCVANSAQSGTIYQACFHFGALYGRGTARVDVFANNSAGASYPLFQNARLRLGGFDYGADNAQFFDNAGAANPLVDLLNMSRFLSTTGISGSGNAGIALRAQNGVLVRMTGTVNLQAATATVRLAAAPTIDLTWTQFLLASDWAQKGTATLVGGTVNVPVPWWDPTTQRLTLGRNTPLGVIGDLSAPMAARTNSQFTINSSNAADVSTVDWQISPLGRNIFTETL